MTEAQRLPDEISAGERLKAALAESVFFALVAVLGSLAVAGRVSVLVTGIGAALGGAMGAASPIRLRVPPMPPAPSIVPGAPVPLAIGYALAGRAGGADGEGARARWTDRAGCLSGPGSACTRSSGSPRIAALIDWTGAREFKREPGRRSPKVTSASSCATTAGSRSGNQLIRYWPVLPVLAGLTVALGLLFD